MYNTLVLSTEFPKHSVNTCWPTCWIMGTRKGSQRFFFELTNEAREYVMKTSMYCVKPSTQLTSTHSLTNSSSSTNRLPSQNSSTTTGTSKADKRTPPMKPNQPPETYKKEESNKKKSSPQHSSIFNLTRLLYMIHLERMLPPICSPVGL